MISFLEELKHCDKGVIYSKSLELKTELIGLGFSVSEDYNCFYVFDYKKLGSLREVLTELGLKYKSKVSFDVPNFDVQIISTAKCLTSYNISTIRALKKLPGFVLKE